MRSKYLSVVLAMLLIAACATPNVTPFAEQTVELETAIAAEKKAVADKMDDLLALIDKGMSTNPPSTTVEKSTWQANRKSYLQSMAVVTQLLSEAKAYSDAVASLAAAGETGADAAASVYDTVQGFASAAASLGGPAVSIPTDIAGSVAGRIFKEVGDLWVRYEAQQSLAKATETAHPAIVKIAAGLEEIFEVVHPDIVFATYNQAKNIESDVLLTGAARFHQNYGNDKTLNALFQDVSALPLANLRADRCLRSLKEKAARLRCFGENIDPETSSAIMNNETERLEILAAESEAARQRIQAIYFLLVAVNETAAAHDRFLSARAETEAWNKTRTARAAAIVSASRVWADTHAILTTVLANCSGFALDCADLSAANLKAAIERINNAVGGDVGIPGMEETN